MAVPSSCDEKKRRATTTAFKGPPREICHAVTSVLSFHAADRIFINGPPMANALLTQCDKPCLEETAVSNNLSSLVEHKIVSFDSNVFRF